MNEEEVKQEVKPVEIARRCIVGDNEEDCSSSEDEEVEIARRCIVGDNEEVKEERKEPVNQIKKRGRKKKVPPPKKKPRTEAQVKAFRKMVEMRQQKLLEKKKEKEAKVEVKVEEKKPKPNPSPPSSPSPSPNPQQNHIVKPTQAVHKPVLRNRRTYYESNTRYDHRKYQPKFNMNDTSIFY